ncbi:MAG: divalent-cation tolerance protein CutA [Candidatus Aenigmatarchaeota archaeon]
MESEESHEHIQVTTTIDDRRKADEIADELVKKDLAACVQVIGPIESTYEWKGQIERTKEWLCILKSKMIRYREIEKTLKELHPYDNPEIIAQPIVRGSSEYLGWIDENLE